MSNRTWVCVDCGKSYRRIQSILTVNCSICGQPCEYVHWKIHIPSPRKSKEWTRFWATYRKEQRLIEQFVRDPRIKEIRLELLNQKWSRALIGSKGRRDALVALRPRGIVA
jgi:hypothetical protein